MFSGPSTAITISLSLNDPFSVPRCTTVEVSTELEECRTLVLHQANVSSNASKYYQKLIVSRCHDVNTSCLNPAPLHSVASSTSSNQTQIINIVRPSIGNRWGTRTCQSDVKGVLARGGRIVEQPRRRGAPLSRKLD